HHLVDLVEPSDVFTAGDYRRLALAVLEDHARRRKLPILTAGTGLYLRALLEGLADAPTRSEELRGRLRKRVSVRGPQHLHSLLNRLDPQAAAGISARDTQKVIRALEIRLLAGKPLAEVHSGGRSPLDGYRVIKIGLLPPRPALYEKIHARVLTMISGGWLDEVRRLIARGTPADVKPFQFIGYSELRAHLEGRIPLDDAVDRIQRATRRFAKRQITWFRKEPGVTWLPSFGDDPAARRTSLELISA
ncbi:MAG TPA: tRNA (adenosine(37)-N6)-dimethylallyltransferase MiaA, partial [Candidatus Acidoferrales bacterium]|nr:tRNA (adenosine(37)-N6)-dimethylallyltransferase MiaA [Candidatus Acidoferrales bacterium]